MKKTILFVFAATLSIASLCVADNSISNNQQTAQLNDSKTMAAVNQETVSLATEAEEVSANAAVASKVEAQSEAGEKKASKHALTRQDIRNMPLLDRPNRPGHFYGNTVRRRHSR